MSKKIIVTVPTPHSGQIKVLRSKARFKVLKCGRRWGKSAICQWVAKMGLIEKKRTAYITPDYSLAKEFFTEFMDTLPDEIIASSNKVELTIKFITGGYLRFFSGESLRPMRGLKFHTVIIDEAAHIPNLEADWKNVIRPTLTDFKGNAFFISTPRGKNFFYTLVVRGETGAKGWETFSFTSYDNPHISKAEIDSAKEDIPREAFRQEYLAIPSANQNAAVGDEDVEKCTMAELSTEPTVAFGIDVAKYHDYTSITGVDAYGRMTYHDRFKKDNELIKTRIKELPGEIYKVMDSTHGSIGDVILEDLYVEGVENLVGFEFTKITKPKLITETILDMERGDAGINEITAKEFSIFEYKYNSSGYISYNAASGGFDDCVISYCLGNRARKMVPSNLIDSFTFGNSEA